MEFSPAVSELITSKSQNSEHGSASVCLWDVLLASLSTGPSEWVPSGPLLFCGNSGDVLRGEAAVMDGGRKADSASWINPMFFPRMFYGPGVFSLPFTLVVWF